MVNKEEIEEALGISISDSDFAAVADYIEKMGWKKTRGNFIRSFREILEYEVSHEEISNDMYKWAKAYFSIDSQPFMPEVTGWNFWVPIFKRGDERKVVIRKASQVGASFYALARLLYHADVYPEKYFRDTGQLRGSANINPSVIYIFPTDTNMRDFVDQKFDPMVDFSTYIRKKMTTDGTADGKTKTDNAGMKKIGDAHIFFRGSTNVGKLRSITGSLVILDEYALITDGVYDEVRQRMSALKLKREIILGNPELPDLNIDYEFKNGTMDRYFIKCENCGKESTPDFFTHHSLCLVEKGEKIDGGARWVCPHCFGDFTPSAPGEWSPENKNAPFRSYHVPRILSPTCDPVDEWDAYQRGLKDEVSMEKFYKHHLGLPYINASNSLNYSDIIKCRRGYTMLDSSTKDTIMGVDWGMRDHYYNIAEKIDDGGHRTIKCGVASSLKEIEEIIKNYNVKSFCCDRYGYPGGMEEVDSLILRLLDSGICAKGAQHANMSSYIKDNTDIHIINYDKSMCMDRLYNRIRSQRIEFPSDVPKEFLGHLGTFVKKQTETRFQYVSKTGKKEPDHWQSALYFTDIALDVSQSSAVHRDPIFLIL